MPSILPTSEPSSVRSEEPSVLPTQQPTEQPTDQPTTQPTEKPSEQPTEQPTDRPSVQPTGQPSETSIDLTESITFSVNGKFNASLITHENVINLVDSVDELSDYAEYFELEILNIEDDSIIITINYNSYLLNLTLLSIDEIEIIITNSIIDEYDNTKNMLSTISTSTTDVGNTGEKNDSKSNNFLTNNLYVTLIITILILIILVLTFILLFKSKRHRFNKNKIENNHKNKNKNAVNIAISKIQNTTMTNGSSDQININDSSMKNHYIEPVSSNPGSPISISNGNDYDYDYGAAITGDNGATTVVTPQGEAAAVKGLPRTKMHLSINSTSSVHGNVDSDDDDAYGESVRAKVDFGETDNSSDNSHSDELYDNVNNDWHDNLAIGKNTNGEGASFETNGRYQTTNGNLADATTQDNNDHDHEPELPAQSTNTKM